jgi:hypothetical protein
MYLKLKITFVCFVEFDWKHVQRKLDKNIIKMNINPVCIEDQSFKLMHRFWNIVTID